MKSHEKINEAQRLLQEAHQELNGFLKTERSRRRGEALRQIHAISNMLSPTPLFFSQAGQDRVIDRLLGGKRDGVFVDVGGYDGVTGSNTLFFEVFRNWTGILIEPSPIQLERAKAARKCSCLGFAVAGIPGKAQFMEVTSGYTQMSGFVNSYATDLLAKSMAKSLAIKTGQSLTKMEQEHLVNSLFACKEPSVSPTNKATFITMSVADLDNKFTN